MKRNLEGLLVAAATAAVMLILGFGPVPTSLGAQSARVGGRDVPVTPFEQWFKRLGLLNGNAGCDVAVEYDSLNTAHISDCTDAANLADLRLRGLTVMGVPTTQGAAGADTVLTKAISAVADATATAILTVTVPNANHQAVIPIVLMGTLGAGGAIGAGECSATLYGQIVLTRTAGVATVATATTAADTGSACVAGATTETLAYAVSTMTGAVTVAQTFTVNVTITKGGGASANHTAVIQADLLNAKSAGVTVS